MQINILVNGFASFIEMGSTAVLFHNKQLCLLVDTSAKEQQSTLLAALDQVGIKPEQIDVVALTHLHLDHCENIKLFRNARLFCSDVEYDWATRMVVLLNQNTNNTKTVITDCLATEAIPQSLYNKLASFFVKEKVLEHLICMKRTDAASLLDYGFQAISTPGHTDGHISFLHQEHNVNHLVTGDALLSEESFYQQDFRGLFTRDKNQARISKEQLKLFHGHFYPGHGKAFYIE